MTVNENEEHAGFEPEEVASAGLGLNTPRPKTRQLNGTKVAIVGGAVALVMMFALITALKPPQKKEAGQDTKAAAAKTDPSTQTAGTINALPGNYTAAALAARDAQEKRDLQAQHEQQMAQATPTGQLTSNQQRPIGLPGAQIPRVAPYNAQGSAGALDDELARMRQDAQNASMKRELSARTAGVTFGAAGGQGGGGGLPSGLLPPMQPPQMPQAPQMPSLPATPDGKAARDEANRQDDKSAFANGGSKEDSPYNPHTLITPPSHDVVQAGTLVPGLFLTGINSDLPGMLTAQVSQNVYDTPTGSDVLIPQGTRLIGQYDSRITFGQERVLLVWSRIVFPNGSSIILEGMPGVDMSGYAGVHDKVDNHYGKLLSGVLFSSILSTAAVTSQGSTSNGVNPSYTSLAAQGAGQAINEAGQKFVQRAMDIQPTLIIRPGQRVGILISKDIQLPPYGG